MHDDVAAVVESIAAPEQFAVLFDRHYEAIHRYIARRAGVEVADDLAAETFCRALASRATFDAQRGSVLPWLYGIAAHLLADHWRSAERGSRAYLRFASQVSVLSALDDHADTSAAALDAGALWPSLVAILSDLAEPDVETLLLWAWEDLSYPEIAEVLAIPVGTVKSRLNRIRTQVKDRLDPAGAP